MLELYSDRFWISPWVFSCYIALKEKGVPFEIKELALDKKETRQPEYARHVITAKVPAIQHDGFWLAESQAIIEYLEETFPSPRVLPAEPKARARARQVMSFLRTDLWALREERSTHTMFYDHASAPLGKDAQADSDKLIALAEAYADGHAWSLADSELAFCLQRLALSGHPLSPRLKAYVDAEWSRPSVQSYVTHPRPAYVPY